MTKMQLTEKEKNSLEAFLKKEHAPELVTVYLYFLEKKYDVHPVLFPKNKTIYKSLEEAVKFLEEQGELWKETEIKIGSDKRAVNEQTKKIYICPFTGKVFGDNTHPNPQDAIYEWVSKCPENQERVGGLKVKRFFVSEDLDVIKNYMEKQPIKKTIEKVVYSSAISGKLFNSKDSVIDEFKKKYVKPLTLFEVHNQNRFSIEEHFLNFLQTYLDEDKITSFVEALADEKRFVPYVELWLESDNDEDEGE